MDSTALSWNEEVGQWRNAAEKFAEVYAAFLAKRERAQAAGKTDEWNHLNAQALTVRDSVAKVATPLTQAYSWATTLAGGLAGLESVAGMFGLSFVPLVPFAVIRGSIAAVVLITARLMQFNSLMETT